MGCMRLPFFAQPVLSPYTLGEGVRVYVCPMKSGRSGFAGPKPLALCDGGALQVVEVYDDGVLFGVLGFELGDLKLEFAACLAQGNAFSDCVNGQIETARVDLVELYLQVDDLNGERFHSCVLPLRVPFGRTMGVTNELRAKFLTASDYLMVISGKRRPGREWWPLNLHPRGALM